ncbi:MAG: hypothetical protein OEM40_07790, partial [Acidimicrobiia bacterium]|nr:hypothetical protein [Acidimicrobiia bacterium]
AYTRNADLPPGHSPDFQIIPNDPSGDPSPWRKTAEQGRDCGVLLVTSPPERQTTELRFLPRAAAFP